VIFIGLWFLSQLLSGSFAFVAGVNVAGIAWWAHVGGFVAGMILQKVFKKDDRAYFYDEIHHRYFH